MRGPGSAQGWGKSMDDPRDDVDVWLSERVKPLLPHPGSFERVRKRARRRKLGQAAIAAGGAAVVVVAAVTVPRFVVPPLTPTASRTPATSPQATSPQPTHSPTPAPSSPSSSPSPRAAATGPPPVPANFMPSSVTFVSASVGWVIGQAGFPGHCGPPRANICTSLAGTDNGGESWFGVRAPVVGPPNGGYGVSQVRSLDGADGWVFGPQLYATHNGGQTWTKIPTHGMRVTDLETVAGRAFAVWARCTGTGVAFAASCTSFSLYSTPAGLDQWAPVPGVTGLTTRQSAAASSAQLALTGTRGYLLAPDGDVYSGPVTSATGWQVVTADGAPVTGCGLPGPAQRSGAPSQSMLATTGPGLVELCTGQTPSDPQGKILVYSPDGGHTWEQAGTAPRAGVATSLSGTPDGQVLVATDIGIDVSTTAPEAHPQALSWRTVKGASLPGGFSYVGMTTSVQGVAIPVDQSLHAVWFTYDGGKRWQASPVR
jgi:hypothetical protein